MFRETLKQSNKVDIIPWVTGAVLSESILLPPPSKQCTQLGCSHLVLQLYHANALTHIYILSNTHNASMPARWYEKQGDQMH